MVGNLLAVPAPLPEPPSGDALREVVSTVGFTVSLLVASAAASLLGAAPLVRRCRVRTSGSDAPRA